MFKLKVMLAASWYLGTETEDGQPRSRESGYFATQEEAEKALKNLLEKKTFPHQQYQDIPVGASLGLIDKILAEKPKDAPWTVQVRPSTYNSWLCAPIRINDGEVDEIVVETYFNEDEAKDRAWRWAFELNLDDFGRNIALAELTDWQRKTLLEEEGNADNAHMRDLDSDI